MLTTLVILLTVAAVTIAALDVATDYGVYRGFVEETYGVHITKFLGIPYAKPPVGDLRFQKPMEPLRTNSTVDCTRRKPACPQHVDGSQKTCAANSENPLTSEDCLYLNIYVPGFVVPVRTESLAVLVWIHGGTFQTDAGPLQDGSHLAHAGEVIVVTINFRLGILGFLGTDDPAATGNWGLLDQVRGLEWIRDNIFHFGGDPNRVTLFGKSSGAEAVGLHVLSPLSRGLFKRAISHGGTSTMVDLNRQPLGRVMKVAQYVNCSSELASSSLAVIDCLRAVPVRDLLKADCGISASMAPFAPVVDGRFLVGDPKHLVQAEEVTPVDYIVGMNSDEGFTALETLPIFMKTHNMNRTIFEFLLLQIYSSRFTQSPPTDVVWSALFSRYLPADDTWLAYTRKYLDAYRDDFAIQIQQYAKHHSARGRCFVYYFSHRPTTSRLSEYINAANVADVQFVFGDVPVNGSNSEVKLSTEWMKAWASFAKSGKPSFQDGSIHWPVYNESNRFYLEIAVNMTDANVKTKLLEGGQLLWDDVIPALIPMKTSTTTQSPRVDMVPMTQETRREMEWGMSGAQLEELLLSLLISVTFLAVICVTLVRMICYIEHKAKKAQKPTDPINNDSQRFNGNISTVGRYKPTPASCHQKGAASESSTQL